MILLTAALKTLALLAVQTMTAEKSERDRRAKKARHQKPSPRNPIQPIVSPAPQNLPRNPVPTGQNNGNESIRLAGTMVSPSRNSAQSLQPYYPAA